MATSPPITPPDNPLLDHPLIKAAFAAGQQHGQNNATGISTPPDGGDVRSISPPITDPQAHPMVPPIGNPDPQASLRPGGSNPSMPMLPPGNSPHVAPPPMRGTIPGEEGETARLIGSGSGASQIQNPVGRGLAEFAGGLEHVIAPGLAAITPGTEDHHQLLVNREAKDTGLLQGQQKMDTANDEAQAQTGLVRANTGKTEAETAGLPQAQQDESALRQAQTQKALTPPEKGIDVQTYDHYVKMGLTPDEAFDRIQQSKGEPGREQQAQLRHDSLDQQARLSDEARRDRETFHADSERDRALTRQQMQSNAADKKAKPTADEQKKADLADNLNENLGVVEEILKRRPDLFGPVAGRMTEFKNKVGTSDPDIAALEAAQHQLGMVQQGVHGMRSAQGMQGAVDAVMNGFHNSPEAMQRALETVRSSAKTFSNAVGEKGEPGIGGIPGWVIRARDPQGKLHEAPAGTALPAGWKKE